MKGRIEIDEELCKGCGLCISVCPKGRIEISDEHNKKGYYPASFKDRDAKSEEETDCTGCALCAITCPDVAIEVYRQEKKSSEKEEAESKDE